VARLELADVATGQGPEAQPEMPLIVFRQFLVTYQDHQVFVPRAQNVRERVVGKLAHVDAADLRAERARQRLDFQRNGCGCHRSAP
jgi:hypothetical protein